jgi:hypothetical protein
MRKTKQYENDIAELLHRFYADKIDNRDIRLRQPLKYNSERGYRSYSPMIDVSVGPFSETAGQTLWRQYDDLVKFSKGFLNDLLSQFRANYKAFGEGIFNVNQRTIPTSFENFLSNAKDVNWNARCFMAIEVEQSGSKKHLLGDMVNVSISGRIGIVIGCKDKEVLDSFLRQLEYFAYTRDMKKLKFNSRNIIVLKPTQFENTLAKYLYEQKKNQESS